jgi:hypothetical protein
MPFEISPVWLSAAASLCSAATALFMVLLNRRNSHDAVRPDLVFGGWGLRNEEVENELKAQLSIATVKNLGKGPARHLWMELVVDNPFKDRRLRSQFKRLWRKRARVRRMKFRRITHLHPGEERDISAMADIAWKDGFQGTNESGGPTGWRFIGLKVYVYYWDNLGFRYDLYYELLVTNGLLLGGSEELAPGVGLVDRRVVQKRTCGWRGRIGDVSDIDRLSQAEKLHPRMLRIATRTKRMEETRARIVATTERIGKSIDSFFQNNSSVQRLDVCVRGDVSILTAIKALQRKCNACPFNGMAAGTILVLHTSQTDDPNIASLVLAYHPLTWRVGFIKDEDRVQVRAMNALLALIGRSPTPRLADFSIISSATIGESISIAISRPEAAAHDDGHRVVETTFPLDA